MATLVEDKIRTTELGDRHTLPVVAADVIYKGAAVGEDGNGYSRPLQAGDAFQGFALEKTDNLAGAAGDKRVLVEARGRVILPIAGIDVTANDQPAVYASDDDTFTLVEGANSLIGYVVRVDVAGEAVVQFDATLAASKR